MKSHFWMKLNVAFVYVGICSIITAQAPSDLTQFGEKWIVRTPKRSPDTGEWVSCWTHVPGTNEFLQQTVNPNGQLTPDRPETNIVREISGRTITVYRGSLHWKQTFVGT